jgi:hypothetical protein
MMLHNKHVQHHAGKASASYTYLVAGELDGEVRGAGIILLDPELQARLAIKCTLPAPKGNSTTCTVPQMMSGRHTRGTDNADQYDAAASEHGKLIKAPDDCSNGSETDTSPAETVVQ